MKTRLLKILNSPIIASVDKIAIRSAGAVLEICVTQNTIFGYKKFRNLIDTDHLWSRSGDSVMVHSADIEWRSTMNDEPQFTAYREDSEPWRLKRLHFVWGFAVALADHDGNGDFIKKVVGLHDHKGTLTVKWRTTPTAEEKKYLSVAWNSEIGDHSANVEHEEVH